MKIRKEYQGIINGVKRWKVWIYNEKQGAYIFSGSYTKREIDNEEFV